MSSFATRIGSKRTKTVKWPEAVRPAPDTTIVACEGYRAERFHNKQTDLSVPALVAAADHSQLFDLFLALLEPLGSTVDVYLESTHAGDLHASRVSRREGIDVPVLSSILYDFEDVVLDDGCSAITVVGHRSPVEVHFDDHKHLVIYTWERKTFAQILRSYGLRHREGMTLFFDVPHVHYSAPEHLDRHFELADAIGANELRRSLSTNS